MPSFEPKKIAASSGALFFSLSASAILPDLNYLKKLDESVDVEGAAPDVERDEVLEGGEVGELADLALVHEHDVPDVWTVLTHERHLLARVKPVLLRGPEIETAAIRSVL